LKKVENGRIEAKIQLSLENKRNKMHKKRRQALPVMTRLHKKVQEADRGQSS
jgi:hypothetical protein